MKKIILNLSEATYEKFRLEAIQERKSMREVIEDRLFDKPFSKEIEATFNEWLNEEINKIIKE